MNYDLFLNLIFAHIIGDFFLQTDKLCLQKETKKHKSLFLYIHSIIIGLLSWATVPDISFAKYAILITISHFIIDLTKANLKGGLFTFITDQILHTLICLYISFCCNSSSILTEILLHISPDISIKTLIGFALITKPTNITIKLILERYDVGLSTSCDNMKNAGSLIGSLERILTMILVIVNQFEAIGFIIAAKSILRFKDTDTAKTEYVLAGTFLSFGIAVGCGLWCR